MGLVGCYSLDLYCDGPLRSSHPDTDLSMPHQFTGRTEAECIRAARAKGWQINRRATSAINDTGRAVCRSCRDINQHPAREKKRERKR